jgi:alpha-1,3/alpha-1,6-mannosyltransferase
VVVYGQWIPRQLFGGFTILLSILRMFWICLMMRLHGNTAEFVFTDQVSVVNIFVRLFLLARRGLIFYCHFPDLLLVTNRSNLLRRLYRWPFDALERYTTSVCDVLLVNSEFTALTLESTFPNVKRKVHVLYPPIDIKEIQKIRSTGELPTGNSKYFLSVNRYERKKDLVLVIEAYAKCASELGSTKLVLVGGYDPRVKENVEYYSELEHLISSHGLTEKVLMLKNSPDHLRTQLLRDAEAVVYSPQYEHFGIVPCEAMSVGTPVIAWNNGGPKESVLNGKTGWLCNDRDGFATAMRKAVGKKESMSKACKDRVNRLFSLEAFTRTLVNLVR